MDLTQTELTLAEVYTITTSNNVICRFTSHAHDILYNGNLYQAIPISRTEISYHTDLQVDEVTISFGLIGIVIGDQEYSIPKIITLGLLRNAHIIIQEVDYEALDELVTKFEGWATGQITYNKGVCTISVGSILDKLNEKFPKYIYSEFCNHQLYGTYCGLDRDDYLVQSAVGAGSTNAVIIAADFAFSAYAENYWNMGEIKMTSGNNAGVSRTIMKHNDGSVAILVPFLEDVVEGDTFDVWPGCDKAGKTCDEKFDNYDNFFGFEYTPKPEVLIG